MNVFSTIHLCLGCIQGNFGFYDRKKKKKTNSLTNLSNPSQILYEEDWTNNSKIVIVYTIILKSLSNPSQITYEEDWTNNSKIKAVYATTLNEI